MGGKSENAVERTLARDEMRRALEQQGSPCLLELTKSFGGVRSHLDYAGVMRDSVFALCPRGHSEEVRVAIPRCCLFCEPTVFRQCGCTTRFRPDPFR